MKIALVGPIYPFRGGIAHYTTWWIAHLSAQRMTRLYSFGRQYSARSGRISNAKFVVGQSVCRDGVSDWR